MEILVKRIAKKSKYTIGKMYIDGQYICDTLEDADRGLNQNMSLEEIKNKKVYGETAVPTGTYKVDMNTVSPKFKSRTWAKPYGGKLPRPVLVPGYDGVLIHPGNKAEDTLGCILVGENKAVGQVLNSQVTFKKIMSILTKGTNITITIE